MKTRFAALSLVAAVLAAFFVFSKTGNQLPEKILVDIPKNSSAAQVAAILESRGALVSGKIFRYWLKISDGSKNLKAGVYEIYPGESFFSVASRLAAGDSYKIKLTIPEGSDSARIAAIMAQKNLGDPKVFLDYTKKNKLEGYLFPETYFFDPDATGEDVAAKMRAEFDRRMTPDILARAGSLGLDVKALVTLASIIEKEATRNDRRLVSAVFHNRLKKRMYLESCATVLYALGGHKEKLAYADLKIKSPYNTYNHYGLPPSPITNPGMDAILAALYPEDSDALFFVVNGASGTHTFSRYYKEHIEAQKRRPRR